MKPPVKKEIAIIGFGRFGKLLARELCRDFRISASDPMGVSYPGVRKVSLAEAASRKVIILALPVGKLQGVLKAIAPLVTPGTLVVEVCAVKEKPVLWMRELLPRSAEILGLHPLFGPDSARRGLSGHRVVLFPVRLRAKRLLSVTRYLRKRGLTVVRSTPAGHDRAMASTLFVTQFIGRALAPVVRPRAALSTPNALLLRTIIQASANDAPELFRDIYRYNRFARRVAPSIVRECRRLLEHLALSK